MELVCGWVTKVQLWSCSVNVSVVFPILWAFPFKPHVFIGKA